jgi:isopenicillin N synthase-like dioxygenase
MSGREDAFVRIVEHDGIAIPIVNLYGRGTREEQKEALARELGKICSGHGFFYVENHGVPSELLRRFQEQAIAFFNLPEHEKLRIHISKSPYHRGYVPSGEEKALTGTLMDIKEVWDMALELGLDDPDVVAGKPFHGPNVWPESMPEFKPTMLDLYEQWRSLCAYLSSLFAISLGLGEHFFVDKTDKPLCQLRIAKYPPQPDVAETDPIGCGAHTDYGIVSIIWQIDHPGLQIRTMDGSWFDAPCIPGTFVCPLGDAIAHWTNDFWPATLHRVINRNDVVRHSSGFFFDPNYDCVIAPLPAFVSADRPSRFAPTTMGEHVGRGFNGTFAYRANQNEAELPSLETR